MSKKQKAKKPPEQRDPEQRYKWDKGDYQQDQTLKMFLPWPFLYVCKLSEVTPAEVLDRFMHDLGQGSWKRRENEAVRQALVEYFIGCGYGQQWYTEQDIRLMFRELDAIGSLWPDDGGVKLIHRHAKWRNRYQDYWFKKWYRKTRRKS
jgi:hypothetical protein